MNIKNGKVLLKDLQTYLVGYYIYLTHFTRNKKTNTYSLRLLICSKGPAIFQIAENGGILKYRLQKRFTCKTIVPSVVKKLATVKVMLTNKKCMRHLQEHKALI